MATKLKIVEVENVSAQAIPADIPAIPGDQEPPSPSPQKPKSFEFGSDARRLLPSITHEFGDIEHHRIGPDREPRPACRRPLAAR